MRAQRQPYPNLDDFVQLRRSVQSVIQEMRALQHMVAGNGIELTKGTTYAFKLSSWVTAGAYFIAKITGNTEDPAHSGKNKYLYSWSEMTLMANAYETGWTARAGGRSGTTGTDPARNLIENMNSSSGVMGNGVDHDGDDYPEGFSLQPAPANVLVSMYEISVGGSKAYWFQYENAEDGTCFV